MSTKNGKHSPRRPQIAIAQSAASPEEAAAVVAAIEQFLHDTTPPPAPPSGRVGGWQRAALFEGAGISADAPSPWQSPWGDTEPWGSVGR
ncbi:MAG: hypothetical protein QOG62_113 [Thermoleophilaceae bacterium]|jgi:hypothetical protein|nr:hypothetical protein [Thermoleophilaceae bacterium]